MTGVWEKEWVRVWECNWAVASECKNVFEIKCEWVTNIERQNWVGNRLTELVGKSEKKRERGKNREKECHNWEVEGDWKKVLEKRMNKLI